MTAAPYPSMLFIYPSQLSGRRKQKRPRGSRSRRLRAGLPSSLLGHFMLLLHTSHKFHRLISNRMKEEDGILQASTRRRMRTNTRQCVDGHSPANTGCLYGNRQPPPPPPGGPWRIWQLMHHSDAAAPTSEKKFNSGQHPLF